MRMQSVLLIAAGCLGSVLYAQQSSSIQRIKAVAKGQMPASHTLITTSAMCDDSGNIYSRSFDPDKTLEFASDRAPIQRITSEGLTTQSFSVSDLRGGMTRTYFVHDGVVYVPVGSGRGDLEIAAFAPDGTVKSITKLEANPFNDIYHLGVFNSGEYLLVGLTGKVASTEPHFRTPVTAVFAADGQLIKTIYEPEDESARQKAEGGDADFFPPGSSNSGNFFVMDADIAAGSDGNLYLLHGGPSALVYAISPAGTVLRKFHVSPGSTETKPSGIRSYSNKLAIEFHRADDSDVNVISVVDLAGNPVAKYEVQDVTPNSDPILACYGPGGFTLVPRWAGNKPYFTTATLP